MSIESLKAIGWNTFFAQQIPASESSLRVARVAAHHGTQVIFWHEAGELCVPTPLAEAAARIAKSGRARDIHQIGPSLSFRPETNAGDLVKACFADRVIILGGGMEGERIRIAPPLTIETTALRQALDTVLSRLDA